MSELVLIDGLSQLVLKREPDGRFHLAVHDREKPGYGVSLGHHAAAEIREFLRPVVPYPTRPEDYRRDQYDPRDEEVQR